MVTMKFKVGDQVLVTAGKDKGKKSKIIKVLPEQNKVVVEGVNMYVKHQKPMGEQSGQKIRRERPLPLSNIAILNDKGQPDRIGYKVTKSGTKERIFRKTGKVVSSQATKPAKNKK